MKLSQMVLACLCLSAFPSFAIMPNPSGNQHLITTGCTSWVFDEKASAWLCMDGNGGGGGGGTGSSSCCSIVKPGTSEQTRYNITDCWQACKSGGGACTSWSTTDAGVLVNWELLAGKDGHCVQYSY